MGVKLLAVFFDQLLKKLDLFSFERINHKNRYSYELNMLCLDGLPEESCPHCAAQCASRLTNSFSPTNAH